jgi:heme A synthase
MSLSDLIQIVANVVLLLLVIEPLRMMKRDSSHLRGFVFLGVGVAAVIGILAAITDVPDSEADTITALVTAMLLIVGCRPITRQ